MNLISIADVVLLLLIFFLLTSSFVMESGIRVKLPAADRVQRDPVQRHIITLTRSGKFFVNGKSVNSAAIEQVLLVAQAESPREVVVIRADQDVQIQDVVTAIDAARKAGVERFMIATRTDN